MAAHNFSQFPYEASCLIADLPTDTQHQILIIGNYVFRPLSFIIAFLALVFNTLVIVAVARTKTLQHPSMVMMCSLAVTDVLFPLYSMYRYIEIFTHEDMCPNTHPLQSAFSAFCSHATLGNLAVISRDRYVAIRSPLWYRNHVTKSRAFKTVCIPWFISVVAAVVIYLSRTLEGVYKVLGQTLTLVFFASCLIVVMFCYLSIYFRKTFVVGNPNDVFLKREKRLANTVAWILLILALTFFPALLVPTVLFAKGVKNFLPFRPYYIIFVQLNGALNPLLNFGRSKKLRKAIRDLFKCLPQVQPSSNANNDNNSNDSTTSHNNSHVTATTAIAHNSSNNTDPVIAMTNGNNGNSSDFTNDRITDNEDYKTSYNNVEILTISQLSTKELTEV